MLPIQMGEHRAKRRILGISCAAFLALLSAHQLIGEAYCPQRAIGGNGGEFLRRCVMEANAIRYGGRRQKTFRQLMRQGTVAALCSAAASKLAHVVQQAAQGSFQGKFLQGYSLLSMYVPFRGFSFQVSSHHSKKLTFSVPYRGYSCFVPETEPVDTDPERPSPCGVELNKEKTTLKRHL